MAVVIPGCWSLWPWQPSSNIFATFRHFPLVEFWFAVHIFLCDSGPSLENCSFYLYMTSEDSMEQYYMKQYSIFPRYFTYYRRLPCLLQSWALHSCPHCVLSLIQLMVICEWGTVFSYFLCICPFNQILVTPVCPPLFLDTRDIKDGLETPPGEFAEVSLNIPAWKYPLRLEVLIPRTSEVLS